MTREEIIQICETEVLEDAAACFGTQRDALIKFPEYEGAANLVYEYQQNGIPLILRISFTPERPLERIQAELDFVCYLSDRGISVSRPVPSLTGNRVETLQASGIPFHVVSFLKGKGMRVPDNGYRYRVDAPIEEYYQNWGRILGQMHARAKDYHPISDEIRRPDWFTLHQPGLARVHQLPDRLHRVRARIDSLLDELQALPRDGDSFGLIHGDFNDGNFTVDYSNGDITVFDFDDSCYFWFVYEIAAAWVGGTGRTMFSGLSDRKTFMDRYMEQVMAGYNRENSLSDEALAHLPRFIQLIQVEEFLHYAQYLNDPDEEWQGELAYRIKCIENDIPYMGFFDEIFSPSKPFSL
jgi:Ser/Thr protein kinase RdoA (MazF antagonist)